MMPKVMILLGSASDYNIAEKAIDIFERLEIPYDLRVASAHRTHEKVKHLVRESTLKGIEVFMGIAGLSAHLPGIIAANTHRPVIGVPVDVKIGGLDALFASSQMPFPAPVATVGIDRGENGALLAAQIIGINNEDIRRRISKLRDSFYEKVEQDENQLLTNMEGNYYVPSEMDFSSSDNPVHKEDVDESSDFESPMVAVIPGSYSDMKVAKKTTMFLERLGITYDMNVISPIRFPERFEKYMNRMADVKLFIAITGLSAHVTGAVVALSEKPVIGVPCPIKMGGIDSLLSMVNMPPGVPVGTVGVANGGNAAILAAEMLGLGNKDLEQKVKRLKNKAVD